jgi:hypothetical protein
MVIVFNPIQDFFLTSHILFVQNHDHREFHPEKNATTEQHIANKTIRILASHQIDNIDQNRRKAAAKRLRNDVSRGRPSESLYLSWSVDHYIRGTIVYALLQNTVNLGAIEIQCSSYCTVRA